MDFTAEVSRSLRVCEGAITVFDGMQGVETQSETVWMQANQYKIPRLGFINKMDRPGAVLDTTVDSIRKRLRSEPLLLNVPSDDSYQLKSLIDLPSLTVQTFDESGKEVTIEAAADCGDAIAERALFYRAQLIEQLANYHDELADEFLAGKEADEIDEALIHQAIFEAVNLHGAVGLYCGSALKNKGIQPLIEGAIRYIPSPENVRPLATDADGTTVTLEAAKKKPLRALAFKVVSDRDKGMITFFRVYQGMLKNRQKLMITN